MNNELLCPATATLTVEMTKVFILLSYFTLVAAVQHRLKWGSSVVSKTPRVLAGVDFTRVLIWNGKDNPHHK